MYNKKILFLVVLGLSLRTETVLAADNTVSVDAAALPINVSASSNEKGNVAPSDSSTANALVSPSQAQQAASSVATATQPAPATNTQPTIAAVSQQGEAVSASKPALAPTEQMSQQPTAANAGSSNFDFNQKVKAVSMPSAVANAPTASAEADSASNSVDLSNNIQYTVDPIENLGNGVLSQLDSDLFTQMSEIEKSTTLLTLELRREKLRNEIEAQKAIRRKNADDFEKQREDNKLKAFEKKKQIEARVMQEQQLVLDKEKVLELLKQRKLLNAYMNQMLLQQQAWLKEKENLYAQLAAAEKEKQELIMLFRQRIDKVLAASAKNIQTAEAAKANFERIVKGLKSRNEQLRKRIEADAKIIKNAKSNMYIQAKSLEELKDKKAQAVSVVKTDIVADKVAIAVDDDEKTDDAILKNLSAEYAILGITGRAGVLSVDLIDSDGQSITLKAGSLLPTGHVVSEIGSNYVRFTRDGFDDFLYVGKTIDGVVPALGGSKAN
jgi:hypothetical protein